MLFELIYRSEASSDVSDDDLLNILSAARKFNKEHHLTGCLLYNNRQFVQILEGEFNEVNELYNKIRKDARHRNVITLHMKEIANRAYSDWTMAFKSLEAADMQHIESALGIREFKDLNAADGESSISRQLFWIATQSII